MLRGIIDPSRVKGNEIRSFDQKMTFLIDGHGRPYAWPHKLLNESGDMLIAAVPSGGIEERQFICCNSLEQMQELFDVYNGFVWWFVRRKCEMVSA